MKDAVIETIRAGELDDNCMNVRVSCRYQHISAGRGVIGFIVGTCGVLLNTKINSEMYIENSASVQTQSPIEGAGFGVYKLAFVLFFISLSFSMYSFINMHTLLFCGGERIFVARIGGAPGAVPEVMWALQYEHRLPGNEKYIRYYMLCSDEESARESYESVNANDANCRNIVLSKIFSTKNIIEEAKVITRQDEGVDIDL